MQTSETGLHALAAEEGIRNSAYPDPWTGGDPWTIGIGHTGPEVTYGTYWDDNKVFEVFREDIKRFEDAVNFAVHVVLQQNQFDALISFTFNVGEGAFTRSTMCQDINAGDFESASAEFPKWCVPSILIPRRRRERAMFDGTLVKAFDPQATQSEATLKIIEALGILNIKSWQALHPPLDVDGIVGPMTLMSMTKAYQAANGLVVDGIIGPATLKSLGF